MIKSLAKLYRYHLLALVFLSFIAAFIMIKYRGSYIQFLTLSLLTVSYLIWALIYHYLDKSLKLEIVLEYILTALLVLIVFYGVLI